MSFNMDPAPDVVVDTIPSSPPPEALDMVEAAARRWRELHDQNRVLRFENEDGGRLRIEVRDLDGNVLRRIPATEAVAVASGEPLWV